MEISIQETQHIKTTTINKISIDVVQLKLFDSITFAIHYYDTNGSLVYDSSLIRTVEITNDEYRQWGEDDEYIINLIKQKINLS